MHAPIRTIAALAAALAVCAPLPARAGLPGPQPIAAEDCNNPPDAPAPLSPPVVPPATLEPARSTVHLAHDARARRTYTLTRPASPTPVDVFFVVDTTSSMEPAICGVEIGLDNIALALHEAGIDAQFGLADFKDYPGWAAAGDYAYRLRRAIGPLDEELIEAVHALRASSGTGDGLTSGLSAVYQAATGAGKDLAPKGRSRGDIPRGDDAGFREDSLKVIITVTDIKFRRRHSGYPGPGWGAVVDALRSRGILQAGISVDGNATDLRPLARATDAIAPRPVDCDADDSPDIARGGPLVCTLETPDTLDPISGDPRPIHMAPAIVEVVKALRDFARAHHAAAGDPRILGRLTPEFSDAIDLKAANIVRFKVSYRCRERTGTKRVHLSSAVRGEVIARATTKVICDPPPFVQGPAPVIAAAAAPPQVPAPQAQPQAQPQAAPHPNVQPNAAVVPQQQEQAQTAMVQAFDDAVGAQGQLDATARRARGPSPLWFLLGGALVTGAAGFAMKRIRLEPADVTTPRERGIR